VAALGSVHEDRVTLAGSVISRDGKTRLDTNGKLPREEADQLGQSLAQGLLQRGAADLLD
jgi:porphobilinogen deaminase